MNTYYDEYVAMMAANYERVEKIIKWGMWREESIRKYAWAIPCPSAIELIRGYLDKEGILEIGAGSGYWAYLVTGCWSDKRYLAYDNRSTHHFDKYYYDVNGLVGYRDNVFICWPSYGATFAYEYLKNFNPPIVIYVGEGYGGCCADDNFFEYLESNYTETNCINIPQHLHLHDRLWVYENHSS